MLIAAKQADTGGLADPARLDIQEHVHFPGSKHVALELAGNDLLNQGVKLSNQDWIRHLHWRLK